MMKRCESVDDVGGRWRWWWVILMMERCESVVLSVWVLVWGFCSLWFLCRWRMKMIMEGLRGGEFVKWIKGNNVLWCFCWWRCCFSSCREQNEKKPPSEEVESMNERTLVIFVVPLLCSFPTSRRGIRLKADVASCSLLLQLSWPWPSSHQRPYVNLLVFSFFISFFFLK